MPMPTMLLATTVMATIPMPTMDTDMPIMVMARGLLMLSLDMDTIMDMLPTPMDMPTMDMDMDSTIMARGPLMLRLMPTTDMDMLPMPTDMPTTATTDIPMPTTDTITNLLNIC